MQSGPSAGSETSAPLRPKSSHSSSQPRPVVARRRYTYSPLPPQYIRILELYPATSRSETTANPDHSPHSPPLACRVVAQRIDDRPYEALSYVWGDPTPKADILCFDDAPGDSSDENDGGVIGIGANLAAALRAFQPHDDADGEDAEDGDDAVVVDVRPRRIWVDALCINQQDVHERSAQVRLMGRVFGTATRVLCWLGAFEKSDAGPDGPAATAAMAMEFLRKVNRHPDECLREGHEVLLHHDGEDEDEVEGGGWDDGGSGEEGESREADEEGLSRRPPLARAPTEGTKALIRAQWRSVKALFDLRYFHRAWIIQEVGLARESRMFWGSTRAWLTWREVADFAQLLDARGAALVSALNMKSWVANHINLVWMMEGEGDEPHPVATASGAAATEPDPGSAVDVVAGSKSTAVSILDGQPKPVFGFVEVLHWARVHESTDPRDYVYALLSHPSAAVSSDAPGLADYLAASASLSAGASPSSSSSSSSSSASSLGAGPDGRHLLIQPDYTVSTAGAYTTLAVNVVRALRSLHIFAFVDHGAPSPTAADYLPTWVPDWHAPNLVAPLRTPTKAAEDTITTATATTALEVLRRPAWVDARAVRLQRGEYAEPPPARPGQSPADEPPKPALRVAGFLLPGDPAVAAVMRGMFDNSELTVPPVGRDGRTGFERERRKKIPFLLDHIWRETVLAVEGGGAGGGSDAARAAAKPTAIPRPSASEFIDAMSFILTGGYRNDVSAGVAPADAPVRTRQRADFAAYALDFERVRRPSPLTSSSSSLPAAVEAEADDDDDDDDDAHAGHDGFLRSLSPAERAEVELLAHGGPPGGAAPATPRHRKHASTGSDHDKSRARHSRHGSKASARGGGGGSAAQFVQDMTWNSMCRKVFRTGGGCLGLGPRVMRVGDVVAVLRGSVYPVVLRRVVKEPPGEGRDRKRKRAATGVEDVLIDGSEEDQEVKEAFMLVGPALVWGFMNGEAAKLAEEGKLQEREFLVI